MPALVADGRDAIVLMPEGEVSTLEHSTLRRRLAETPYLVCHRAFTARRLGMAGDNRQDSVFHPESADIMELFAFVLPVTSCLPTPRGLARALGLEIPESATQEALTLHRAAAALMARLTSPGYRYPDHAAAIAAMLHQHGWPWGEVVADALTAGSADGSGGSPGLTHDALAVWRALPEWRDIPPRGDAGDTPPPPPAIERRLEILKGAGAEARSQQDDYAQAAASVFAAPEERNRPHVALVEAGTGTGKTLGYIAPASLWAEQNSGTVWISTYTRNLQHQLRQELARLYDLQGWRDANIVTRKGRENYLCLLNLQTVAQRAGAGWNTVAAGLVARWARYSRHGDTSDDFPAWLLANSGHSLRVEDLSDRRGECIHDACPHYRKCCVERVAREARHARIVVANHALVLTRAASRTPFHGEADEAAPGAPDTTRYIFDEGHHLFEAADSAFSSHLTAGEAAELRRWLLGGETDRGRGGQRHSPGLHRGGLAARLEGRAGGDDTLAALLVKMQEAALDLPAPGWGRRIERGMPHGVAERFFTAVRQQVYARATGAQGPYTLEAYVWPLEKELLPAARDMAQTLARLVEPLGALAAVFRDGDEGESLHRLRHLALWLEEIGRWRVMLADLERLPEAHEGYRTDEDEDDGEGDDFVDWLSVDKRNGREYDTGLHRHYLDPTKPFAHHVLQPAHGALITSATLHDPFLDEEQSVDDWRQAVFRTGARHLPEPALRFRFASPFDYEEQTRVFVATDVNRDSMDHLADAYRALFLAAGGGALGLFTAISRLRAVHERISAPLHEAGLMLFAQHVDALDAGTLVDLFRSERNSCLLGTDAFRDGIDVSGASLRLIVLDRTPWPRPDILHRARRARFGGRLYDDSLARLRLRQAFGRLIRKSSDRGVFVLLDNRAPSRVLSALPDEVASERLPLGEIISATNSFFAS